MAQRTRLILLPPVLALLSAGCLGNPGGPAIPSTRGPREPRVAAPEPANSPPTAKRKLNFRRKELKSLTAPRGRTPMPE